MGIKREGTAISCRNFANLRTFLKSISVKKNNPLDSIFRRFGHFGNCFLNFILTSLFTMRRDPLQIILIYSLKMDTKNYLPKY